LECVAIQKWSKSYYSLIDTAYSKKNIDRFFLIKESINLWVDIIKLNKCLSYWTYIEKIKNKKILWFNLLNITGTPGNVFINNETWEYDIIIWAYPTEEFVKVIDKLLK
jgi:hypothetical protein